MAYNYSEYIDRTDINFPSGKCFSCYQGLNDYWKSEVDSYIDYLSDTDSDDSIFLRNKRQSVSYFCFFLQSNMISDLDEITVEICSRYFRKSVHRSTRHFKTHIFDAYKILTYKGRRYPRLYAYGLYFYFKGENKLPDYSHSEEEKLKSIYTQFETETSIDTETLISKMQEFLNDLEAMGYSLTVMRIARFILGQILVFVETYKCLYTHNLIEKWFDIAVTNHSENSPIYRQKRKIVDIFDEYVGTGVFHLEKIHIYKTTGYDLLPQWCKDEIDSYIEYEKSLGKRGDIENLCKTPLIRFCNFLVQSGVSSFSAITPLTLKEFNITDKHSTPKGKNDFNSRIRIFLKYLERKGIIQNRFLHDALLCASSSHEKVVIILTDDEKRKLDLKIQSAETPLELRDKAIILLGLRLGLRAVDAVSLKLSDIDWKNETLRILQKKTGFEVVLPMPIDVGNALYQYITEGRPEVSSEYVFLKSCAPFTPIKSIAALKALKRSLPERNVPKSGFHVVRRTFATDCLKNNVEPSVIADMLGQHGIDQLGRYLSLDDERMLLCSLSLGSLDIPFRGGEN